MKNRNYNILQIVSPVAMILVLSCSAVFGEAFKWDYLAQPVHVTENPPSHSSVFGLCAGSAFDGYGAQGSIPAAVRAWAQPGLPTTEKPYIAEIDYGRPITVSAFVHYFYVPLSRDMRSDAPGPSAFKTLRISSKNESNNWTEVAVFQDLPTRCPQVLPVNASQPAQFWRIEVLELAPGAEGLCSYEIETYEGGIPNIEPWTNPGPDFMGEFTERITTHKPSDKNLIRNITLCENDSAIDVTVTNETIRLGGMLTLFVDGNPRNLRKLETKNIWKTSLDAGDIFLETKNTKMGCLLNWTFRAASENPVKHIRVSIRLAIPDVDLYYIPAYVWTTDKSKATMVGSCSVQTRMAAMGVSKTMLLLVPGTDRGAIGFSDGAAQNDLLIGEKPTPVLITAIQGDWWNAYQFAVKDIYHFSEPKQTVPISEIQYGISNYLMRDDIWEPTLGTLKSWSPDDPHTELYGFDCFAFYGTPYSIPAYWARYVMNGDHAALQRCKSIVNWLCKSGVRMKEGPAKGAFFNSQRFRDNTPVSMDLQGETQAGTPLLTSQSTGAALWSLLYYRKVTGDQDSYIDSAIQEAAAWLLKTQNSDGGWPYAHNTDGTEYGLKKKDPPAPSSGSIWNIWALWKLGNETGNSQYFESVDRAKIWFHKTYMVPHHYHGYWEDVGANSREGYDAAIAAIVFDEMGDKELALEAAKDAMQWVFTRQIEPREPSCSAGLVAEQTGWPPASYCNPMMGLAAWGVWQHTQDGFWKSFARIPKAIGWWYQPERRAMVWIVDSTQMAPIVGPCFESWWSDWINAQTSSLALRWLIREMNQYSKENIKIDEEFLSGKAFGKPVQLWTPPGGFHPILPPDGQVNWLGLHGEDSIMIAFMNNGNKGKISCPLDSRDVLGASLCPKSVYRYKNKKADCLEWNGSFPLRIESDEMIVLEWRIKP